MESGKWTFFRKVEYKVKYGPHWSLGGCHFEERNDEESLRISLCNISVMYS